MKKDIIYAIIVLILLGLFVWLKPEKPVPVETPVETPEPLPIGSILPANLPPPSQEEIMVN